MSKQIKHINPNGKLTHLVASDLFEDGLKNVFCAKTGRFLGSVAEGRDIDLFSQEAPDTAEIAPKDPNQLALF